MLLKVSFLLPSDFNNMLIQYGFATGNTTIDVYFPLAFVQCYIVVAEQFVDAADQTYTHSTKIRQMYPTYFKIYLNCKSGCWIAIGSC